MPWLYVYLVGPDVAQLCAMLDSDPEVALIVPAGRGKWRAQNEVPELEDGEHLLWHIPSGPIVLEPMKVKGKNTIVKEPLRGWKEIVKPQENGVPWISAAPLGIIRLTIRRTAGGADETFTATSLARPWRARASDVIGLSGFGWVGNYYSIIGDRAPAATSKWWKSLRRRIEKMAIGIPTSGPLRAKPREAWAFPAAMGEIRRGKRRADNPS